MRYESNGPQLGDEGEPFCRTVQPYRRTAGQAEGIQYQIKVLYLSPLEQLRWQAIRYYMCAEPESRTF